MFDLKRLKIKKERSLLHIQNSSFFKFITQDIIDRLLPINNEFRNILVLKSYNETLLIDHLNRKYSDSYIEVKNIDTNFLPNKHDLIIFPMGLHWIDDIEIFFSNIRNALKSDGFFISNFPGGSSLNQLRYKLIEVEVKYNKPHTPHISPLIKLDHVAPLLQQAGFMENIIDMQTLTVEHDSPLDLMKNLQKLGESNILRNIKYSINKEIYKELSINNEKSFFDTINLITFISSPIKNSIKLKKQPVEE